LPDPETPVTTRVLVTPGTLPRPGS
jgi:hypothetical protein